MTCRALESEKARSHSGKVSVWPPVRCSIIIISATFFQPYELFAVALPSVRPPQKKWDMSLTFTDGRTGGQSKTYIRAPISSGMWHHKRSQQQTIDIASIALANCRPSTITASSML